MLKTETIIIEEKAFTLGEHTLYIDFKREDLIGKAIEEKQVNNNVPATMRIGYV